MSHSSWVNSTAVCGLLELRTCTESPRATSTHAPDSQKLDLLQSSFTSATPASNRRCHLGKVMCCLLHQWRVVPATGIEPASTKLTTWGSTPLKLRKVDLPIPVTQATVSGSRLELAPVSALDTAPREHSTGRPDFPHGREPEKVVVRIQRRGADGIRTRASRSSPAELPPLDNYMKPHWPP